MLVSIQFCLALVATWFVGTFAAVLPRAPMAGPKPYAVQQRLLDTDWTDKVGTEPWGEYPRPQLQRDKWQNLNGIWLYLKPLDILEQFSETNLPVWGDFAEKGREVLVPSCLESALSGKTAESLAPAPLTIFDRCSRAGRGQFVVPPRVQYI